MNTAPGRLDFEDDLAQELHQQLTAALPLGQR